MGGRKVNPRDVERVILELDGVDDVVVTSGGEGTREWVEAVVASGAGNLSVRDVLRWCRSQLAPFKTPRRVVVVPALPRDQRGKLEGAALAALRTRALGGQIADEQIADAPAVS